MKVLIAVDDSDESRHAVDAAFRFFGSDADYSVVSVGDRPPIFVGGYGAAAMPTAMDLQRQLDAAHAGAEHAAIEAMRHLPMGAQVEIVDVGHAGQTICEYAGNDASDMIVIGSHERSFWERLVDPSVAKYLVDHAPCPVLVVR